MKIKYIEVTLLSILWEDLLLDVEKPCPIQKGRYPNYLRWANVSSFPYKIWSTVYTRNRIGPARGVTSLAGSPVSRWWRHPSSQANVRPTSGLPVFASLENGSPSFVRDVGRNRPHLCPRSTTSTFTMLNFPISKLNMAWSTVKRGNRSALVGFVYF